MQINYMCSILNKLTKKFVKKNVDFFFTVWVRIRNH